MCLYKCVLKVFVWKFVCSSHCHQVLCLPHKTQVYVTKCRSCNVECTSMSPSASKVKVDVAKCDACHTKSSGVTRNQARHQSQPSAVSVTPATQSAAGCRATPATQSRAASPGAKVARRHPEPSAPPEPAQ